MNRRTVLGLTALGAAQLTRAGQRRQEAAASACPQDEVKLAGMSLKDLRRLYHEELFQDVLPFWHRHGVDQEKGGIVCALDYDGTRANSEKQLWFQGRAIWTYSFLYNNFGRNGEHLEAARKTKEFVLNHAPQPDGWWAEVLADDGRVLRPFRGDIYGMYFVAEGLQEYAWATKNENDQQTALGLVKKLYRYIQDPEFRFLGTGAPGVRAQGLWMVTLRIVTQMLQRWEDSELEDIAKVCVEAIIEKHYNSEIMLNNEMLNFDFSRPKEEKNKSLPGHSIETLWMVMDEADRNGDDDLWQLCAERIERHIEVGWDRVYGGLVQWINVDNGGYVWPVERPVGTDFEFRFIGEYHYMKPLWALHEILVATMKVFERTRAQWAARYFSMAQCVIDEKFSRKRDDQPGYMLFGDRKMTPQAHVARQDNYHPPRQLMLNLLTLDRMIAAEG
jgi:N-acylglucosamine 2-epimerase